MYQFYHKTFYIVCLKVCISTCGAQNLPKNRAKIPCWALPVPGEILKQPYSREQTEAVHYIHTIRNHLVRINTHQDSQACIPTVGSDSPSCSQLRKSPTRLWTETLLMPGGEELGGYTEAAQGLLLLLTHLLYFLQKGHDISPQLLQFLLCFPQLLLWVLQVFLTGFGAGIGTCLIWIAQVLQTHLILLKIFFL